MAHKFDPKLIDRLESAERRSLIDAEQILSYLPLEPDQTIADVGCGTGYFTIPLARYLSSGAVYGLDVSAEMLKHLSKKLRDNEISNVKLVQCSELDFPLPKKSLDGVLMAFVLHEQDDMVEFLEKAAELLKPGGWITVIEWEKTDTGMGPPAAERIDQTELGRLAASAGLAITFERVSGDIYYLVMLRQRMALIK